MDRPSLGALPEAPAPPGLSTPARSQTVRFQNNNKRTNKKKKQKKNEMLLSSSACQVSFLRKRTFRFVFKATNLENNFGDSFPFVFLFFLCVFF